jgi:crossover junction endodeoxyribonuclease RuvC
VTILAVDPGTACGWALRAPSGAVVSGVWNLRGGRFEGGGMRFLRLRRHLDDAFAAAPFHQVAFEEVRRHLGVDAAHIYGGVVATLTAFCEERRLPYQGIPVGTVKRLATGKGNADKAAMLAAAATRWPGYRFADDNEADARWIAEAAVVAR